MSEKVCSIIYELPKSKKDYLKKTIDKINCKKQVKGNSEFHLTLKSPFVCHSEKFRVDLEKFLEKQEPFDLTLNTVSFFKNSYDKAGLIYLTTNKEKELEKITDLHNQITKIMGITKERFTTHISLFEWAPLKTVDYLVDEIQERLNPIELEISTISMTKKTGDHQWGNYGRFDLGGKIFIDNNLSDDFVEHERNENLALSFE